MWTPPADEEIKDQWQPPQDEEIGVTEETPMALSPEPQGFWQETASNILPDIGKTTLGLAETVKSGVEAPFRGVMDSAKTLNELVQGKSLGETTLGQKGKEFSQSAPGMLEEMARPVTHPIDYFKERPVSQLLNVLGAAGGAMNAAKSTGIGNALERGAVGLGKRSLGFTKRFLSTEAKEAAANEATLSALKNKIISPLDDADDMLSKVNLKHKSAGQDIGSITDELSYGREKAYAPRTKPTLKEQFFFDQKKAIEEIEKLRPKFRGGIYDADHAKIDQAIETIKMHGDRPLPWNEANELKTDLQRQANFNSNRNAVDLDRQIAGVFRNSVDTQLDEVANATGQGDKAKKFFQAKKDYKTTDLMKRGLENKISSERGNNLLGLTDVATAGAATVAGGPISGLFSLLGKKVLDQYGLATGARSLYAASKAFSPEGIITKVSQHPTMQAYKPILANAMNRGGEQAVASTHYVLMQQNPDYNKAFTSNEDGQGNDAGY